VEKEEKPCSGREKRLNRDCGGKRDLSTHLFARQVFHRKVFLFHRRLWKYVRIGK
jgi:hypothetical protein